MAWKLLDLVFIGFHSVLVLFNLFGWIPRRTRRLNLVTLLLTGLSWTLLGVFYGFGYCPLTDWHWAVLRQLGEPAGHTSYIQYLAARTTGIAMSAELADKLTLALYLLSLVCSVYMNFFAPQRRR